MINQAAKLFIVAVLVLIPCIVFALPGKHDPSRGGLNYQCSHCHTAPKTLGKKESQYSNNWCLSCHISGNSDTKNQFDANDYSNIYKTGTVPQSSPMRTSHKWFGTSNVRAAGTTAITIDDRTDIGDTGMNRTVFVGSLACTRCHSVHGNSGVASVEPGFLRMPNDSSQLCTACHTYYNTTDHKTGSHPINVSYTSARNANILAGVSTKTSYRTLPVTNPINPTGQVKLVNGKVNCATCHGIHNTDSRTSTFDPYSSNHTYGQLSSSKGYLLRVDAFGKTGTAFNICSNCHVSKNHNMNLRGGKMPVQCNDCHSGHVEYDPADLNGTVNVNLVRRYLQYTTAGRVSKRILYRSDTTKEYWNSTKTGVCQVCHAPPANHFATTSNYPNGAFVASAGYAGCAGCHNHAEPTGAFSYGLGGTCANTCHGLPPTTAVEGPTTGRVVGYTRFSEANTPHGAHAAGGGPNVNDFDCNECHNGYTMPRDDANTVVEVFVTPRPLPGNASYTKATYMCNNVYCHSNGNGTWKSPSISWASPKGTIIGQPDECQKCHDDPNSSAAHTKHLAFGYGCVTCHAATVLNNTTLLESAKVVGGTHTNKVKEVAYSGVGAAVGSSCATIACHSNGFGSAPNITPTWGTPATGACGACHWTKSTSTVLSTGSHSQHFALTAEFPGTEQQVCVKCHTTYTSETNVTHVNGAMNTGGTGCAVCHASPYSTASSTPAWGSISTGCGQCHTLVGAFTGLGQSPNTGSHTKHMRIPLSSCNQCHTGAVAGSNGGATHADANVDVTNVGYPAVVVKHTAGSGYSTCTSAGATGCHVNPYSTSPLTTPTWGQGAGCASCHILTGAFTGTNSSPTTGGHTKHIAKSPLCANCHAGAVAGSSGGNFHIDGNVDVTVVGYTANVTKHTAGSGYATCTNAGAFACHASPYSTSSPVLAPTWGSATGCASCHTLGGAFTGSGTSPTTGSHTKHIAAAAVCSNCHAGAVAGTSGGNSHSDGNIDVIGGYTANVTKHTAVSYTGTCNTTSCHGSYSPVWGFNGGYDYCTRCHGTGNANITTANRDLVAPNLAAGTDVGQVSTSNNKTGAHRTHLLNLNGFSNYSTIDYRCESCHGALPSGITYSHADGTSSPIGKYKTLANNWGKMTGQTYIGTTCANTYCHNPAGTNGSLNTANTGTGIAPSWINAAYIADGTKKTASNCNQCHKVPGRAGFGGYAHAGATSDTYVATQLCNGCHGHNGDSTGTVIGKRHMDGIKQGGGGDCKGCHGYPPLSSAEFAARGAGYVDAALNNNGDGGNASHHLVHLSPSLTIASGKTPCLPCHPDVDTSGVHGEGGGNVVRSYVQVNTVTTDFTYTHNSNRSKRYNPTARTCSNISCHFQPTTAW